MPICERIIARSGAEKLANPIALGEGAKGERVRKRRKELLPETRYIESNWPSEGEGVGTGRGLKKGDYSRLRANIQRLCNWKKSKYPR